MLFTVRTTRNGVAHSLARCERPCRYVGLDLTRGLAQVRGTIRRGLDLAAIGADGPEFHDRDRYVKPGHLARSSRWASGCSWSDTAVEQTRRNVGTDAWQDVDAGSGISSATRSDGTTIDRSTPARIVTAGVGLDPPRRSRGSARPQGPSAKKSIIAGVLLVVAGPALHAGIPEAYAALVGPGGTSSAIGTALIEVVLTVVRLGPIPLGAVLIGTGVVVRALTGGAGTSGEVVAASGRGRSVEREILSRVEGHVMAGERPTVR